MVLEREFKIQLMTIEFARNQRENEEELKSGLAIDPSTKPNLFLVERDKIIDLFHELKPTPLKTVETRIELGVSEEAMKKGLELLGTDESLTVEDESAISNDDED